MAKKIKQDNYSAKDITNLTPREHLIKRTALTFGRETGDEEHPFSSQKSVAIRELQDNSVGELLRGFGSRIRVTFYEDNSVEVQDDGRGLPTDTTVNAFGEKVSGFIITLGTLQSGENLGENSSDGKSTSQNGLGASATVALSSRFDTVVYKDKHKYSLSFKDGIPGFFDEKTGEFEELTDLTYIKKEKDNRPKEEKDKFPKGTSVRTWLNPVVFTSPYNVDIDDLILRLKGNAYLIPGSIIEVVNYCNKDENGNPQHEIFTTQKGIQELVDLKTTNTLSDIIFIDTKGTYIEKNVSVYDKEVNGLVSKNVERTADIQVAFNYSNNYKNDYDTYVNTIRTRHGGVHVSSFEKALVQAFNDKFSSMKGVLSKKDPIPTIDDYREGLTMVMSCYISEPEFTNQIKEELGGREVARAMYKAILEELTKFANASKNSNTMRIIGEKVVAAAKARQKEIEKRDLKREQSKLERSSKMPIKLLDCEITHNHNSELHIVEGDSALSGLKSARLSKYQALLPIRGKIINALKAKPKDLLANQEIQDIIRCLDAGFGEDYNHENARYQKVIIAADADPDGSNIRCLILVALWIIAPEAVLGGHVYNMETPLYIIEVGKQKLYAYSAEEKEDIVSKLNSENKRYNIVRAKGLGEAGTDVLEETGMNPQTRNITQITVSDIQSAVEQLEIIMGDDVAPRKEWLENNPIEIKETIEAEEV